MFYGPVSDCYWSQPLKLLMVNLEPYGYQDCGKFYVDRDCLLDWMSDAGSTNTRTVRYTVATAAAILDCHKNNLLISPKTLKEAYRDISNLERALERITYYNLRPHSNYQKPQSLGSVATCAKGELGAALRSELTALEPDIGESRVTLTKKSDILPAHCTL